MIRHAGYDLRAECEATSVEDVLEHIAAMQSGCTSRVLLGGIYLMLNLKRRLL